MSFLSQAFQSQSANNTTSIVSAENSTRLPLGGPNGFFLGQFVPSSNYSVVQLSCVSDTLVQIVVESSFDGIVYTVTEAFYNTQADIDATRAAPFYGFITLPYVRILIQNIDTITNTVFEFCTKLTSTSPPSYAVDPAPVIIIGTAQVQDLPLENIAGVLGTKPVGAMVINDWYRVASPGDTLGAVWAEIGAYIVPGESAPRVGALFQCDYVFGDFSPTAGKVWDVQYNSWEEDNLIVAAGDLQVVEKNSGDILTAVNSIDGKIVTCDTSAVVVASGNINIDNFPATQPISGSVSITGALPEGTNNIGYIRATAYNVGVDSWQAIQIDAGNTKVVETNSADILTAVNSIDSKIISCDTASVTISSALPNGSATIGAVNLSAYNKIIPDFVQLNSVPNSEMNDCLCVSDLAATNLEINANKTSYVENITPQLYPAGNGLTIDMDTNQNRMRNITVLVKADVATYTNPSVMIGYSEDEINFFFDGNFASFYDLGGNVKSCVLQRTQVPTRYARVYFNTDTEIILGIITTQKS